MKSVRSKDLKKFMGAAALFLVCLLSVGGVAYAMTDGFRALFTFIGGGAIYETTESSIMGTTDVTTIELKDEPGIPLLLEEGRLYFTGDGEKKDITDLISETEPYFIDVVDEVGNTHKFIVGGRPEEESYGYDEIIIDTEGVIRGGVGRFGSKIDMTDGTPEWVKKAELLFLVKRMGRLLSYGRFRMLTVHGSVVYNTSWNSMMDELAADAGIRLRNGLGSGYE